MMMTKQVMGGNKPAPTLTTLREVHGFTRQALALQVGITPGTIGKWERGVNIPRLDKAVVLAEFFGVPLKKIAAALGFDTSGIPDVTADTTILKDFREAIGAKSKTLAIITGVSTKVVTSWQLGTAIPRTDRAVQLAKVFEVSLESVAKLVDSQNVESLCAADLDTSSENGNRRASVAKGFWIESDNASEHLALVAVSRLLDRSTYCGPEELGEIINSSVQTAIKMVREANRIVTAEPICLEWVNSQMLYDLIIASEAVMDRHTTTMIARAEGKRVMETSNDSQNLKPWVPLSDEELRILMHRHEIHGVEPWQMRKFMELYGLKKAIECKAAINEFIDSENVDIPNKKVRSFRKISSPLPSVAPEDWVVRAIDWAQEKLSSYNRDQLQELFDKVQPDDSGDKKRPWTNFVKDLAKQEAAKEVRF